VKLTSQLLDSCSAVAGRKLSRLVSALVLSLCVLVTSACASSRGGSIAYEVPAGFETPDAPRPVRLNSEYQIATGDTLTITVFRVEDLSGDYRVDLAGNISIPLIGNVPAVARTTADLGHDIANRLSIRYLKDPAVTVAVKESVANTLTVEGGVREPGMFPVNGPLSLVQSVALAGGIEPVTGNPRRIAVFRRVAGQRMAAAFDLVSIRSGEMADPEILPGDIVVVQSDARRGLFQDLLQALPVIALFRPI
jgi:polysaccharide export outer membrane protein